MNKPIGALASGGLSAPFKVNYSSPGTTTTGLSLSARGNRKNIKSWAGLRLAVDVDKNGPNQPVLLSFSIKFVLYLT